MKKLILNKLVKQALLEIINENKNLNITPNFTLKDTRLTKKEKKSIYESISDQKDKKWRSQVLKKHKSNLKKAYHLLKEGKKKNISLNKILKNSIFKNFKINEKKLVGTYSNFEKLNVDKFNDLLPINPLAFDTCECFDIENDVNNCPDYGEFPLYGNSKTCEVEIVDDRFVCCSSNNRYSDAIQLDIVIDGGDQSGLFVMSGNPYCFPPEELSGNITYNDFNDYWTIAADDPTGLIGDTPGQASFYDGSGESGGPNCLGCPHPNDTTNYNSFSPGCNGTPGDISCCKFTGCGAQTTLPPASNLTIIPPITNDLGYAFEEIVGNELEDYWEEDGTCIFQSGCTQTSISIDGTSYTTLQSSDPATYGEVLLDNVVTANYNSYYTSGIGTFVNDDGSCIIEACQNENLNNILEPGTGNPLPSNYVTSQPDSYQINPNNTLCEVGPACITTIALNYVDPVTYGVEGDYTIIGDVDLCIFDEFGCSDLGDNNTGWLAQYYEEKAIGDPHVKLFGLNLSETEGFCTSCWSYQNPAIDPFGGTNVGFLLASEGFYSGQSQQCDCCCDLEGDYCPNPENVGCMDPNASNYDASVEVSNISLCEYTMCTFDLNNDILGPWTSLGTYIPYPLNWVCFTNPEYCLQAGGAECTNPLIGSSQNADDPLGNNCYENTDVYNFPQYGTPINCEYHTPGCMDPGGVQSWGDIGPFIEPASNYNSTYTYVCDGLFGMPCVEGPDGVLQQITEPDQPGYNPYGCCCNYTMGCTDSTASNYDSSATVDDGSCIGGISGCIYPGFDNYDPTANINDGSCSYDGCVDDGSNYNIGGGATISNFGNYICLQTETLTAYNPLTGVEETNTIGEWLCDCGGDLGECNNFSNPVTAFGLFTDGPEGPNQIFNSLSDINDYCDGGALCGEFINGQCEGTVGPGCWNEGNSEYIYEDVEGNETILTVTNYNYQSISDDGSCEFLGCDDPNAPNYFCSVNPSICVVGDDGFAVINPLISDTITPSSDYPCEYGATYDCINLYNQEPGQELGCNVNTSGTGEFTTLSQCEAQCHLCSEVTAKECNSDNVESFDCLRIDGLIGDPAGIAEEAYTIGAIFETPPTSPLSVDSTSAQIPGRIYEVLTIDTVFSSNPILDATISECQVPIEEKCADITAQQCNPSVGEMPIEGFDCVLLEDETLPQEGYQFIAEGIECIEVFNPIAIDDTDDDGTYDGCYFETNPTLGAVGVCTPFYNQSMTQLEQNTNVSQIVSSIGNPTTSNYGNTVDNLNPPTWIDVPGQNGCQLCNNWCFENQIQITNWLNNGYDVNSMVPGDQLYANCSNLQPADGAELGDPYETGDSSDGGSTSDTDINPPDPYEFFPGDDNTTDAIFNNNQFGNWGDEDPSTSSNITEGLEDGQCQDAGGSIPGTGCLCDQEGMLYYLGSWTPIGNNTEPALGELCSPNCCEGATSCTPISNAVYEIISIDNVYSIEDNTPLILQQGDCSGTIEGLPTIDSNISDKPKKIKIKEVEKSKRIRNSLLNSLLSEEQILKRIIKKSFRNLKK